MDFPKRTDIGKPADTKPDSYSVLPDDPPKVTPLPPAQESAQSGAGIVDRPIGGDPTHTIQDVETDVIPTRGQIKQDASKKTTDNGSGTGPETEEDRIARRNKASGISSINKLPGMSLVNRASKTAEQGVEGSMTMPLSLARRVGERVLLSNPIGIAVKFAVNLLPIRNPYVRFGASACGTCGGQMACTCACSTFGQIFALLLIVIIVATFVLGGSAPTFEPPAFCSMAGATACANSTSVSVTVDPRYHPTRSQLIARLNLKQVFPGSI